MSKVEFIKSYLAALEQMQVGDALSKFFHPDVEQTEFPNKITPVQVDRNLAKILDGAARGKAIMSAQSFQINNLIEGNDQLVAEITWTGTLALKLGNLKPDDKMVAHFACIFEFKDGLIFRQRNYDCFEAF